MRIVESAKIGINVIDIIYCPDKQAFGADIKVFIDVDWGEESKSMMYVSNSIHVKYEILNTCNVIFKKIT